MNVFTKNIIFRTIQFEGIEKLYDYPKYLPIPRIGETVMFKDNCGIVKDIRHIISESVSEIKIVAKLS